MHLDKKTNPKAILAAARVDAALRAMTERVDNNFGVNGSGAVLSIDTRSSKAAEDMADLATILEAALARMNTLLES